MSTNKLPDQFITNNMSSYSASYTDHYMYGNIFSSRQTYQYTIPNTYNANVDFVRTEIAFSTNDRSTNKVRLDSLDKTMWFSDYLHIAYGRYIPSKTANYATQFVDETEYYYDSYTPNPFKIFEVNSGVYASNTNALGPAPKYDPVLGAYNEIAYCSHYSGSRQKYGIEDYDNYPELSASLGIVLKNITTCAGYTTASYAFGIVGEPDSDWRMNYPFSAKYRALKRNLKLTRQLFSPRVATYNVAASASFSPLTSSIIGTIAIYTSGVRTITTTPAGYPWNSTSEDLQFVFDMPVSSSEGASIYNNSSVIKYPNDPYSVLSRKAVARDSTIQNLFFCLGQTGKYHHDWADFEAVNFPEFIYNTQYLSTGLKIRGYKYGLVNANPTALKAYWRRDRYGQFRDRLEQRHYTKTLTPNPNTVSSYNPSYPVNYLSTNTEGKSFGVSSGPVSVNFLTNSLAYITASQYANFNPNVTPLIYLSNSMESGIYDYEYRSARPFVDRDV